MVVVRAWTCSPAADCAKILSHLGCPVEVEFYDVPVKKAQVAYSLQYLKYRRKLVNLIFLFKLFNDQINFTVRAPECLQQLPSSQPSPESVTTWQRHLPEFFTLPKYCLQKVASTKLNYCLQVIMTLITSATQSCVSKFIKSIDDFVDGMRVLLWTPLLACVPQSELQPFHVSFIKIILNNKINTSIFVILLLVIIYLYSQFFI